LIENIENDVWSIINHNDALSDEELNKVSSKTDNDQNTIYIANILKDTNIQIKRIIYLTNTD
jgi:Txe/YoeB family toxin of Txe-Axe toxin-antitoxin module